MQCPILEPIWSAKFWSQSVAHHLAANLGCLTGSQSGAPSIWGAPSGANMGCSSHGVNLESPIWEPISVDPSDSQSRVAHLGANLVDPYLRANLGHPISEPVWCAPSGRLTWVPILVTHLGANWGHLPGNKFGNSHLGTSLERHIWEPVWTSPSEN